MIDIKLDESVQLEFSPRIIASPLLLLNSSRKSDLFWPVKFTRKLGKSAKHREKGATRSRERMNFQLTCCIL